MNSPRTSETFKFYKGPPPSLGWWPVKINFIIPVVDNYFTTSVFPEYVSWWNGKYWSVFIWKGESFAIMKKHAKIKIILNDSHHVFWSERPKSWPAHSLT